MSKDPDAFWDRVAVHSALRPGVDPDGRKAAAERLQSYVKRSHHVLELSGGSGALAREIAPLVARYDLTDPSPAQIEMAEAAAEGLPTLRCRVGRLGDPALPRTVDVVVAMNLLHRLPDLPHGLRQINGLLRPGGLLCCKTPVSPGPQMATRGPVALWRRITGRGVPLTAEGLERMVKSADFGIVSFDRVPRGSEHCMIVARKN